MVFKSDTTHYLYGRISCFARRDVCSLYDKIKKKGIANMIYTIEDITVQIDEFFKDFPKEERDIAEKVKEDVASVISDNIENACVRIKDYIDLSDANGKKIFKMKNKLPDWIKTLVYVCIYNYLTDGKAEYTQTELLEKIGIPKDIFRKKHWNMTGILWN